MSDYRYKMVNGELVELTAEELEALDERDKNPPPPLQPPPDAVALATLTNSRIDRGIEAGYDAINQIEQEIDARLRQRRQITPEDIEQQLIALTAALRTMINAQRGAR